MSIEPASTELSILASLHHEYEETGVLDRIPASERARLERARTDAYLRGCIIDSIRHDERLSDTMRRDMHDWLIRHSQRWADPGSDESLSTDG